MEGVLIAACVDHRYLWLYVGVLISLLVHVSDIFTAVTMLTTTSWSNAIFKACPQNETNGCVYIPFSIGRWLFFGCVIFSFLLVCSISVGTSVQRPALTTA